MTEAPPGFAGGDAVLKQLSGFGIASLFYNVFFIIVIHSEKQLAVNYYVLVGLLVGSFGFERGARVDRHFLLSTLLLCGWYLYGMLPWPNLPVSLYYGTSALQIVLSLIFQYAPETLRWVFWAQLVVSLAVPVNTVATFASVVDMNVHIFFFAACWIGEVLISENLFKNFGGKTLFVTYIPVLRAYFWAMFFYLALLMVGRVYIVQKNYGALEEIIPETKTDPGPPVVTKAEQPATPVPTPPPEPVKPPPPPKPVQLPVPVRLNKPGGLMFSAKPESTFNMNLYRAKKLPV